MTNATRISGLIRHCAANRNGGIERVRAKHATKTGDNEPDRQFGCDDGRTRYAPPGDAANFASASSRDLYTVHHRHAIVENTHTAPPPHTHQFLNTMPAS